jgi:hypothetical protein
MFIKFNKEIFDGKELKDFLSYISDLNLFESIIKRYKEKLTISFKEIDGDLMSADVIVQDITEKLCCI